ncbi:UNVERIFIED_CONTAM: hypothetical protein ABID98_001302 [Brevibacillus sp. OAP136]
MRKVYHSGWLSGTIQERSIFLPRYGDIREKHGQRNRRSCHFHRVLDLSILICRTIEHFRDAYRYEHLYDPQKPVLDRVGLQGDAMSVAICTDNEKINEDSKLFSQALSKDDEMISERLRTLSRVLKELGY